MSELLPLDYQDYLAQLKERIRSAQVKAALAVNRELECLLWLVCSASFLHHFGNPKN